VVYPEYPEFRDRVRGQEIAAISRRGKYAAFQLASGDALIIHRGMTGSLLLRRASEPMEPHARIRFRLDDDEELRLDDPRKFGKVYVMRTDGSERPLPWARMGPEPLDGSFTVEGFREKLGKRTALIKPLLLGQRVVAGLGNIYVDEALFLAGIHPERRANTLTRQEVWRLHGAIRKVLGEAVARRGTTFSSYKDIEGREGQYQDWLRVFRKTDAACPRCGGPITRRVVGGRGTHFCPRCQTV
jgi:formamidopyrimidine-DNA glycosylase